MAFRVYDRVKETSTTTGTGDITLAGAVTQFQTFASRYATNDLVCYAIVGQTGAEWEVGCGHLSGSTTLVRDIVYESSNSDGLVNFSAGTKDVFATITAKYVNSNTQGRVTAFQLGYALP